MTSATYDVIAEWYEAEFLAHQRSVGGDGAFQDAIGVDQAIVELLGRDDGLCLEVGCGTGIYGDRLRRLGWSPIGIDISSGMLRHASGRLPVCQADAGSLPFPAGSLSAVAAIMVHTDMPDYRAALREIRRVLAPGGVFVHVGVHPCFNGAFVDRTARPDVIIKPGYLHPHWVPAVDPLDGAVGQAGQVRDKVGAAHVPLHELLNCMLETGFKMERALEGGNPTPITLSVRCTAP